MPWLNEPQKWKQEGGQLSVFADAHTDFWRKTHYGFVRDNGHFYYEKVSGNFEIETEFRGKYESLYDQAGLMDGDSSSFKVRIGGREKSAGEDAG